MKYFTGAIIIIVILLVIIVLLYLLKTIRAEINSKKILRYGRKSESFIYDLLRTYYSANKIIKNAYFKQRNGATTQIDIVLVLKGGIHVIEIKGMKGFIENPFKGDWCQMYNNKVLMFQNPFEQNVAHIRAIQEIFRKEEIINVPIRNIVVFTDPKVKFKYKEDMLLTSANLLPFLHDLNQNKFLKPKEISYIIKVLRKYQLKGRRVQRNHIDQINSYK